MAEKDVTLFQLENVTPTQKIVGSGAYGRVIEVATRSAAKELHQVLTNFASPQELARLQQKFLTECHQCSQLCHPNIVQFLGIYYPSEDAKLPWLVMEKMDCSLTEYLSLHKPNEVSFQTRISILHDVTLGLQYLHIQDIIHRDLSSNNILLTKQLVAKIADLGVAKVIDPNRTKSHSQAPGTIIFMPPEALLVRPCYGKPVDVFSLGCVMIHAMTHIWPVPKDEVYINEVTGKKTVREEVERREDYLELIQRPEQLKELIKKCLNDLPEQRPSISDISQVFRELKPDLKSGKMYSILFEYEPLLLQKNQLSKQLEDEQQARKDMENQLSKQLEEEQQTRKDMEDRLTKATTQAQELLNTYEANVQELRSEKLEIEKHMKHTEAQMLAGYKEREDRIAELEEFINDQVTELNKMEAAMKQTVATKQLLEKDYQKLSGYYDTAKKLVEDYQNRLITQEEKINEQTTAIEKVKLIEKDNQALSEEVKKLRDKNIKNINKEGEKLPGTIDITEYQLEIRKLEEELQTKEFILRTYKEDFEAERRDRENAHNIKEDEIIKARVEKETFEAQCQEKVHNIKQALQAQMNGLKEQVNQYAKENDKLRKECGRLHAELDKEKKDAQGKSDVYKKKTEQFQLQWRKREEAETRVNTLTEQLNAQRELNKQLLSTIDSLVRKSKGMDPQIPSNNMATQQSQQQRVSPHNPPFQNMSTPVDTSSDQYRTSTTMSKLRPPYDPSTNAGMSFQQPPPSSSSQQQAWQIRQEQQHLYKMQQQHQEDRLYLRGQGRGPSHNQPVKPLHEGIHYPPTPNYQGQGKIILPPSNVDKYQPRSIQPEYYVAGTNAAPMQGQFPHDDYNHGRNSGSASLDGSMTKLRSGADYTNHPLPDHSPLATAKRPEKPTQYASEDINEEIRYQADKQRRHQEYERFDPTLQLDPYLICPKCKLQFREGQLPEYRHHIDNCNQ